MVIHGTDANTSTIKLHLFANHALMLYCSLAQTGKEVPGERYHHSLAVSQADAGLLATLILHTKGKSI